MPSLHFGNAAFMGFVLVGFASWRVVRVVALFWPFVMGITVFATANHFVMDVMAGAGVFVVAWWVNWVMLVLLPVERGLFGLFGLEKPNPRSGCDGGDGDA